MGAATPLPLLAVGLNQATAPVAVRERVAVAAAALPEALRRRDASAAEGFLLSTCNRVELYAVADPATGPAALAGVLAAGAGLTPEALAPYLYTHAHDEAARHLFRVAAGLDSLVLGEDQILAQVKAALEAAQAAGTLGPALHRLGHMALATGKQVRAATALSRHPLSVVSVALRLAGAHLGDLRRRAVLVVGAGQTATLVLKHLGGVPRADLTVINRTAARAAALAGHYGARARPWAALEGSIAEADLVVTCTSAPGPVIDAPLLARALETRPWRPLLVLDLAVPRDVEPAGGALPGLTLYDVDSLTPICAANRAQRAQEIAGAAALVEAAVGQYLAWWRARTVAPTIAALRGQAEAIRDAEVARALARLPGLPPAEQVVVRRLAEALVNKLLHAPVTALRTAADGPALAAAASTLFGLPDDLVPLPGTAWPNGNDAGGATSAINRAATPDGSDPGGATSAINRATTPDGNDADGATSAINRAATPDGSDPGGATSAINRAATPKRFLEAAPADIPHAPLDPPGDLVPAPLFVESGAALTQ